MDLVQVHIIGAQSVETRIDLVQDRLRDSPPPLGPGRIGMNTLVASTISSRRAKPSTRGRRSPRVPQRSPPRRAGIDHCRRAHAADRGRGHRVPRALPGLDREEQLFLAARVTRVRQAGPGAVDQPGAAQARVVLGRKPAHLAGLGLRESPRRPARSLITSPSRLRDYRRAGDRVGQDDRVITA